MNSRAINNTTGTPITRTPMGHTSYAMSTRKAMRERVDNNMQKAGIREDNLKEKKIGVVRHESDTIMSNCM